MAHICSRVDEDTTFVTREEYEINSRRSNVSPVLTDRLTSSQRTGRVPDVLGGSERGGPLGVNVESLDTKSRHFTSIIIQRFSRGRALFHHLYLLDDNGLCFVHQLFTI